MSAHFSETSLIKGDANEVDRKTKSSVDRVGSFLCRNAFCDLCARLDRPIPANSATTVHRHDLFGVLARRRFDIVSSMPHRFLAAVAKKHKAPRRSRDEFSGIGRASCDVDLDNPELACD